MALLTFPHPPGTRVRVTQQTPLRDRTWSNAVEGVIQRFRQARSAGTEDLLLREADQCDSA